MEITNHYGFPVLVDNVTVNSSNAGTQYQLCGSKEISLTGSDISVGANASSSNTSVAVTFDGGTSLTVAQGATQRVQVPVLPVGSGNKFNISVTVHKEGDAAVTKTYTKTQTTGGAMARAKMAYAGDTVGYTFSVAADRQVIISQGNLQYQASTGTFRFALHQYDYIGSATGNTTADADRPTQSAWIDLFGWGTSGWSGSGATYYQPYENTYLNPGRTYGPPAYNASITGEYANADWGVYNPISNGGNLAGQWRTLTKDEWVYLQNTHSGGWTGATINGTKCLLLLPVGYEHPDGVTALPATLRNGSFSTYVISDINEWCKIEAAGGVLMPAAGCKNGGASISYDGTWGFYWLATGNNTNYQEGMASQIMFRDDTPTTSITNRSNQMAVRLVMNAN